MTMKTFGKLVAGAAAAGLLAVSATAAGAVTIRYSEYGPERGVRADTIKWFAEEVEKRSGGDIEIDLHWGGALVGGREVMRAVESGFVDAGTFVPSWSPQLLHLYEVGDLPTGSADPWVAMRALYDVTTSNEALIEDFAENNAVYLMQFNTGPVQLICRDPIETIEDFKGKRIRAVGPYIEAFTQLGAEIVSFPQIEVYQALDSGLVDCNQVYWTNVTAYRLHEVAKHLVQLDFGQMLGLVGVMNKDLWDELTDEQRQILRETGRDAVDYAAKRLLEIEDEVKGRLTAGIDGHVVTISPATPTMKETLVSQADGLANAWLEATMEAGLDGEGVKAAFDAAQEEYAAELAEKGYPWSR